MKTYDICRTLVVALLCLAPLQVLSQRFSDSFSAAPLVSAPGNLVGDTWRATAEPDEPAHAGAPALHSVWIAARFTSGGYVKLTLLFVPVGGARVAIYKGGTLPSLVELVATNIFPNTNRPIECYVEADQPIAIAVDTVSGNGGSVQMRLEHRTFWLSWPPPGSRFTAPALIDLTVSNTVVGRELSQVNFLQNGRSLGVVSQPPWSLLFTNTGGTNILQASASFTDGTSADSPVVYGNVSPPNDDFINAVLLPSTVASNSVASSFCGATIERGEPVRGSFSRSLWWVWNSPYRGFLDVEAWMLGASGAVGFYTGPQVDQLTSLTNATYAASWFTEPDTNYAISVNMLGYGCEALVRLNHGTLGLIPPAELLTGDLSFTVTNYNPEYPIVESRLYLHKTNLLAVSSPEDPLRLNWSTNSAWVYFLSVRATDVLGNERQSNEKVFGIQLRNDLFSKAVALDGRASHLEFDAGTRWASEEPGEPNHAGFPAGKSTWWSWTPETECDVRLSADFSDDGMVRMAVYTGDELTNLAPVAALAKLYPTDPEVLLFHALPGVHYRIAVAGNQYAYVYLDRFSLSFASPAIGQKLVVGVTNWLTVTNYDATFTPAAVEFWVGGANAQTLTSAPYTWPWLPESGGWIVLQARATNAAGDRLSSAPINYHVGPANDDFALAQELPGNLTWEAAGSTEWAGCEPGEFGCHAYGTAWSVWYRWRPTSPGISALQFTGPPGVVAELFSPETGPTGPPAQLIGSENATLAVAVATGQTFYFRVNRTEPGGVPGPFTLRAQGSSRLTSHFSQTPGELLIEVSGSAGHRYEIQRRTDVSAWEVIGIITCYGPSVLFTDEPAPGAAATFYRLRLLDP